MTVTITQISSELDTTQPLNRSDQGFARYVQMPESPSQGRSPRDRTNEGTN